MSDQVQPATRAPSRAAAGKLRRVAGWAWQRPWLALPILALPALWPFLEIGLPHSADGALHLLRVAALDHQVRQGMLYPRWSPELFSGLGYPVFNFYGPLTYYLAELLHLLGLDFVAALIAAFALLVLASGFGMYRLASDVLGVQQRWAALTAAVAYMVAPYLLTNVYVRGALAEVGAQAWLPWVFWSTRRLLTAARPAQYLLPAALTLGGLAITHNITLLLTPLALLGYILALWQQSGRPAGRLGWMGAALAAAMGLSAFFWLPLIGERSLLATAAYEVAGGMLEENAWTWRNFLDMTLAFDYTFAIPVQLGLVQAALAVAGAAAARRRDVEWLYFIVLALATGLAMGAWALPLWLASDTLRIVQFPWRLLALMSLPLALFTGALLLPLRREALRVAGACLLLGLIIAANRPQLGWMPTVASVGEAIRFSAIPQFELETKAMGTTATQEFRPRWSVGSAYEPDEADLVASDGQAVVSQSDGYGLTVTTSFTTTGPLRFTSLYYPGWQATLADGATLPTYPSTNLGLLTVDLPAGEQQMTLRWTGTALQRVASWLSLATLALLTLFVWRTNRPRWLAAAPLSLLVLGLAALLSQPARAQVTAPAQSVRSPSLELAGYRQDLRDGRALTLYPFWYVRQNPPADTLIGWQLRAADGSVAFETTQLPYFGGQTADQWPAGTLADDAYRLSLPPGLAAGSYSVAVQVTETGEATPWTTVGAVTVESAIPRQEPPQHALDVTAGDLVRLVGYDLALNGQAAPSAPARPTVVRPGDQLELTLWWQALQRLPENYHGFLHLLGLDGVPLAQRDQVAGSLFRTPMSWDTATMQPDRYELRIPDDAPPGLVWPLVGLYEFESLALLPVEDAAGQPLGDAFRLPPLKVLGKNPATRPQNPVNAQLGDLATLLGYDLALPAAGLRPGSPLTVTLYYRVDGETDDDLTQFVQLHNPELGMAAQQDAPPQQGANPTWAWVPGEIVVDTLTLHVNAEAAPGDYDLLVGLYNPGDGVRLPVTAAQGDALPEGHVRLASLRVGD